MSGGYRGPLLTRVLSADFELGSWILGAGLSRKAREARAGAIGAGGACACNGIWNRSARVFSAPRTEHHSGGVTVLLADEYALQKA